VTSDRGVLSDILMLPRLHSNIRKKNRAELRNKKH
jgi:hypothetical protein